MATNASFALEAPGARKATGEGLRRSKKEDSGMTSKSLAEALKKANEGKASSPELLKYLQGDNFKFLANNESRSREYFGQTVETLAQESKHEDLEAIFGTTGFAKYYKSQTSSYTSWLKKIADSLFKYLTNKEDRTSAAAEIAQSILTDNDDGTKTVDQNHERLRLLKANKGVKSLYTAAMSLGLGEEINRIIQGINQGADLGDIALSGEVRKAEIEADMQKISDLVDKNTGAVYQGEKRILEAITISASEAQKINATSDDGSPLVKPGEKLNIYEWLVDLRVKATNQSDAELSQAVNRFIDKYIAVLKLRADDARQGSPRRAEELEETAQRFMKFISSGSFGLPKSIRSIIQRGLDFSPIDAIGNKILVNGSDDQTPQQTLIDELGGFAKLAEKRPDIFGAVDHLGSIINIGNNKLNTLVAEKADNGTVQLVRKELEIVTDSNPDRGREGYATFAEVARHHKVAQEQVATQVASTFTKNVFSTADCDISKVKAFSEHVAEETTSSKLKVHRENNKNNYSLTVDQRIENLAKLIGELKSDQKYNSGVAKDLSPQELNAELTKLVNKIITSSVTSGSTPVPESEVANIIKKYNAKNPSNQFSIETSLAEAVITGDVEGIKKELAKVKDIVSKAEASVSTGKWSFTINDNITTPSESRMNGFEKALDGGSIRSFMAALTHDKNTPDPLRAVTAEHIISLIESTDELKDELLNGPGVHSSIENFDQLKSTPDFAGPEASVLFSERSKLDNKSADARSKFTVLLGLLKRAKEKGSISEKRFNEILGSAVEKFFADDLRKHADANKSLSETEARRERKEEVVEQIKTFLDSSENTFASISGGSGAAPIADTAQRRQELEQERIGFQQALHNLSDVSLQNRLSYLKARLSLTSDQILAIETDRDNFQQQLEDSLDPTEKERLAANIQEINNLWLDPIDSQELQREVVAIEGGRQLASDPAEVARLQGEIARVNSEIKSLTTGQPGTNQDSSISSIEAASQMISASAYRRMILTMSNKAVVASGAEVAAQRIAAKINAAKKDTATTLSVMKSTKEVLESHLTKLEEFRDGNHLLGSIIKELKDNPKAQNMIMGLAGEKTEKALTEDKKYNPRNNIEDLLEKWIALLESLDNHIDNNVYEASDKEQARMKGTNSGSSSATESKPAAPSKKEREPALT